MNDHPGFLIDIIAHPADDTPRKIYADWLEEHGRPERGEIIRVQCELAKSPGCEFAGTPVSCPRYSRDRGRPVFCPACAKEEALRRRERELLDKYALTWLEELPDPPGAWLCTNTHPNPLLPGPSALFRRGLVAEISCTLSVWRGTGCAGCFGNGNHRYPSVCGSKCRQCHGTGRINGHGAAIVLAAPVEKLTLTDVRAERWGDGLYHLAWARACPSPADKSTAPASPPV